MADKARKGRAPRVDVKLSLDDAIDIRTVKALGASSRDIAAAYGVTRTHVANIIAERCWRLP